MSITYFINYVDLQIFCKTCVVKKTCLEKELLNLQMLKNVFQTQFKTQFMAKKKYCQVIEATKFGKWKFKKSRALPTNYTFSRSKKRKNWVTLGIKKKNPSILRFILVKCFSSNYALSLHKESPISVSLTLCPLPASGSVHYKLYSSYTWPCIKNS